jgi:hypothetical protein
LVTVQLPGDAVVVCGQEEAQPVEKLPVVFCRNLYLVQLSNIIRQMTPYWLYINAPVDIT